MIVKILTEHHLEFLSLKGSFRGSSESTPVKLLEISCRGSFYCFDCQDIIARGRECYRRLLTRFSSVEHYDTARPRNDVRGIKLLNGNAPVHKFSHGSFST